MTDKESPAQKALADVAPKTVRLTIHLRLALENGPNATSRPRR
ncbi:hypothetical protein QOM21_02440 [Streptomyces sp. Pv4-95]